MAREVLQDQDFFGIQRGKINSNFLELYTLLLTSSDVLTKVNNIPYTPVNPYNPATKDYVDKGDKAITDTYDPQGISGDAFNRDNHTGNVPATNVTQDALNRFITDIERTAWNNKEDAIGAKGTAFNKNFGTIVGTVAEGDHSHTGYENADPDIQTHITQTGNAHNMTKADISLGSVDNIGNANRVYNDYNGVPEASHPSYKEGRVFFDTTHHALAVYSDISGVTQSLGQEIFIRVWNNTGVDIPNGTALRYNSTTEPVTGALGVVPAQADDITKSRAICLATHDIPDGTTGFGTELGTLHDTDTSSFSVGDVLYLDPLTAGGMTNIAPDIVTILGAVTKVGLSDGEIYVRISINVVLPTSLGILDGKVGTLALTTSYKEITGYTTETSAILPVDKTTGIITANASGSYRATVNVTLSFTSAPSTRTVSLQLWDKTSMVQKSITTINIPKDATSASRSFSKIIAAVANNDYVLRILTDTAMTVSFTDISLDFVSVYIGQTFVP